MKTIASSLMAASLPAVALIVLFPKAGSAQATEFVCATDPARNDTPTTFAVVPGGPVPIFSWSSTYFPPPWTPMRRCQEVSKRMTLHNGTGGLDNISAGHVNGQPVICAGLSCASDGSNLLYTLKRGQNPAEELDKLLANRSGASNAPIEQSANGSGATFSLKRYLRTAIAERDSAQPGGVARPAPATSPTPPSQPQAAPAPRW